MDMTIEQQPPPESSGPPKQPIKNALFDPIVAELDLRVFRRKLNVLPDNFNPLDPKLQVDDFVRLGLPPRPSDADALRLWLEMIPPGLKIMPPFEEGNLGVYMLRADMAVGVTRFSADQGDEDVTQARVGWIPRGRLSSSRNWSGAAIFANHGDRFSQVIASWTVPEVKAGDGDGPWVCSTWIGIDGFRRWMKSMPQMGTTQIVGDTGERDDAGNLLPQYFAWWQWWLRGRTIQVPVVFPTATIAPGKKVYCCVTLLPPDQPDPGDRHHVQFFLRVDGTGYPVMLAPPPTNDPADIDGGRRVPASGASAEWILERPTALHDSPNGSVKAGDLFPLPDFTSTGADDFAASLAADPDPMVVASIAATPITPAVNFRTPLKLRMMEHRRDPSRMAVIAKPAQVKDGTITVDFQD
jgi:hypothetical protein